MIEQASNCIQFEIGTETVNNLKFNRNSQTSEQFYYISQNRGSSRVKELEKSKKNWLCLNRLREKNLGFHMIQTKFFLTKL